MLNGGLNTRKYVKLAAINCEGGNFMALAKYADADALQDLKDWQFFQSLNKKDRQEYRQLIDDVQNSIKGSSVKEVRKVVTKPLTDLTK